MIKYRVTIADAVSIFCAVYEVCAIDPAMAVFRAMASAQLDPQHRYQMTTEVLERWAGEGEAVVCVSVVA